MHQYNSICCVVDANKFKHNLRKINAGQRQKNGFFRTYLHLLGEKKKLNSFLLQHIKLVRKTSIHFSIVNYATVSLLLISKKAQYITINIF